MIVRINGKIVDFVSNKTNEINTIGVPDMDFPKITWGEVFEQTDQAKEYMDFSDPLTMLPSINEIDSLNYYWMSKIEATEFIYRFSKWSVSEVLTALNVI